MGELKKLEGLSEEWLSSYEYGSRLIIDAYHPAQTQIAREDYVDSIKELIDQWTLHKGGPNT